MISKPLTRQEFEEEVRMLEGSINRICVTKDIRELLVCFNYAVSRLDLLLYSRYLELEDKKE